MSQVGSHRYLFYASEEYALAVLRPLQAAIRTAGGESAWFFDGPGARYLRDGERRLETVAAVREFDPVAVFVPGNLVPDFFPGIKVEVFHGFSVGKRSDRRGHFRIRGLFDLYCTHGPTTTEPFTLLAGKHGHFRVAETGWPKMDPLFDGADGGSEFLEGWKVRRPLILFASTFTRSLTAAPHLAPEIRRLVDRGPWNWLVTLHPKMPEKDVRPFREMQGPQLRFVETDDIIPLLRAADLMVSDTSSVIHEFLVQHKPVVTLRNTRPGPWLIDIEEPSALEAAVERGLERRPELMQAIEVFSDRIHPYRDGRSSLRVLEATHRFLDEGWGGLRPKPLNLTRRLKLRRRLGYWRWR